MNEWIIEWIIEPITASVNHVRILTCQVLFLFLKMGVEDPEAVEATPQVAAVASSDNDDSSEDDLKKDANNNNLKDGVVNTSNEDRDFDMEKFPVRELEVQFPCFKDVIAFNPLVSLIGVVVLWGLSIWCMGKSL